MASTNAPSWHAGPHEPVNAPREVAGRGGRPWAQPTSRRVAGILGSVLERPRAAAVGLRADDKMHAAGEMRELHAEVDRVDRPVVVSAVDEEPAHLADADA